MEFDPHHDVYVPDEFDKKHFEMYQSVKTFDGYQLGRIIDKFVKVIESNPLDEPTDDVTIRAAENLGLIISHSPAKAVLAMMKRSE